MYRGIRIPRLRASGSPIAKYLTPAHLKRKALNSVSALQDTFYSTTDIFERHKVVFTICTSIASVATAWAGYTLRHYHESKVDQRLEAIEKAMNRNYEMKDPELKTLVSGTISFPACVATAGTSLIIGYGLGWRGGAWYIQRKLRREQMKLLGQIKPKRWPLKFLKRPLIKTRPSPLSSETAANISEPLQKDASSSAATS